MKKKSTTRSKERDKKPEESKSHKHSRRKRKSSSSESEGEPVEVKEAVEDAKTKRTNAKKVEPENNTAATRITRHSRRLAAISASSEEVREEINEIASPVKVGKLSPFSGESKGSPSKDRKRDSGTPDKHRAKDSEVWKVKSANGAGSGELQKLKICRQRSPEHQSPEKSSPNADTTEVGDNNAVVVANNVSVFGNENEKDVVFPTNEEDIANIQLPSDEPTSIQATAIADIQLPSTGPIATQTEAIANIQLPAEGPITARSEAIADIQLPSEDPVIVEADAIDNIQLPLVDPITIKVVEYIANESEIINDEKTAVESQDDALPKIECNIISQEDISMISLPDEEPKLPQSELPSVEKVCTVAEDSVESSPLVQSFEEIPPVEAAKFPTKEEPTLFIETIEQRRVQEEEEEEPSTEVLKSSELEDNQQTEIVLTVEENTIEDAADIVENDDIALPETKQYESELQPQKAVELGSEVVISDDITNKTVGQVDEIEEIYDYEHDDTKEEGELSANESASPIHEVFKKLPAGERVRSWGRCTIFNFDRSTIVVNESILKDFNIRKRTVSKEELDTSDPEDLIFVKEIREENIVHEIESETNNTSYVERDDEDVVPRAPKNTDEKERRKRFSDSDGRKTYTREQLNEDKSHERERDRDRERERKRLSKERRVPSGEGRTVLYITNLVRPFTVTQLRELLLRTGRIVEDGFWIDSIKSKCYVQFETADEALETRHALHGIRWPFNNPKVLSVQFASQDDLLSAQAQTDESEIPRKTEPLVVENHNDSQKRIDWKKRFEQYDERPTRKIKDVREWDIGKPAHPDEMIYVEPTDSKRKEELEKNKKFGKDRRRKLDDYDDESAVKKPRKTANDVQPPVEAKLLDDLFKRTKASPSIYWLPLSEEQIAVKQEARRKHLEDLDKQMKKRDGDGDRDRRRNRDRRRSRH